MRESPLTSHPLTLSYLSKINGYLYHQKVLHPWKNALIYYQWTMLPILFVWIQACWVGCDSPLLTLMVPQKAISFCRGLSHPTRSVSRMVCRGQERPKGRKGTLTPDFQANNRPSISFKKPMSPQDTGRQCWGNPGIVSLRQFRDNEAWIQLGQESPLMNKKGLNGR